jgi:hypothetical protein
MRRWLLRAGAAVLAGGLLWLLLVGQTIERRVTDTPGGGHVAECTAPLPLALSGGEGADIRNADPVPGDVETVLIQRSEAAELVAACDRGRVGRLVLAVVLAVPATVFGVLALRRTTHTAAPAMRSVPHGGQ